MKANIPQELCLSFQLLYSVLPYLDGPLRPTRARHLFPSHWAQYPICCVQTFIDWCHPALAWGCWAAVFTVPMPNSFKQIKTLFFAQQNVEQKSQFMKVKHPPNQMNVQGSKRGQPIRKLHKTWFFCLIFFQIIFVWPGSELQIGILWSKWIQSEYQSGSGFESLLVLRLSCTLHRYFSLFEDVGATTVYLPGHNRCELIFRMGIWKF